MKSKSALRVLAPLMLIAGLAAAVGGPSILAGAASTMISPGSMVQWHVPATACSIRVELIGGAGQTVVNDPTYGSGGAGGMVVGYLPVGGSSAIQTGHTLDITAGASGVHHGDGAAPGGTGGGVGGGATGIIDETNTTVLAVAGGGGATPDSFAWVTTGGQGGAGGIIGTPNDNGGVGGAGSSGMFGGLSPAGGANQNGPGAGASFGSATTNYAGSPGAAGVLGGGGAGNSNGGGGGGGYYGGGGGAAGQDSLGGGAYRGLESAGGGGSSYVLSGTTVDHVSTPTVPSNGDGQASVTPIGCGVQRVKVKSPVIAPISVGDSRGIDVTSSDTEPQGYSVASTTPQVCSTGPGMQFTALSAGTCRISLLAQGSASFKAATKTLKIKVKAGPAYITRCSVGQGCLVPWIHDAVSFNYLWALDWTGTARPVFSSQSDGVFTAMSKSKSVCTVASSSVVFHALGICKLKVTQAAGTGYTKSKPVTVSFYVGAFFNPISIDSPMTAGQPTTVSFSIVGCETEIDWSNSTCTWNLPNTYLASIASSVKLTFSMLSGPVNTTLSGTTFSATFTVPANARIGSYTDLQPAEVDFSPSLFVPVYGVLGSGSYSVAS